MEKVSPRKSRVLEALDEEIHALEEKLSKFQPYIDELNQLKKTRATLLSERTTTGSIGSRTKLNMESVVHALTENENEPMSAADIATAVGVDVTVVRSHLNRFKDQRYEKDGDGWILIGYDPQDS